MQASSDASSTSLDFRYVSCNSPSGWHHQPYERLRIQGVVLEAQACQAEAQSEKNSWLLKIGNFSWQSQGLAVATGAKSFCNAWCTNGADFTFAVSRSGRHGRAASFSGCVATFQTFRTNQRTDQSQRASAFSLVLTYLGWAGGFGGASVDLTVHFEAVGKWLFPWWWFWKI